jgi:hypothetical protein
LEYIGGIIRVKKKERKYFTYINIIGWDVKCKQIGVGRSRVGQSD